MPALPISTEKPRKRSLIKFLRKGLKRVLSGSRSATKAASAQVLIENKGKPGGIHWYVYILHGKAGGVAGEGDQR